MLITITNPESSLNKTSKHLQKSPLHRRIHEITKRLTKSDCSNRGTLGFPGRDDFYEEARLNRWLKRRTCACKKKKSEIGIRGFAPFVFPAEDRLE